MREVRRPWLGLILVVGLGCDDEAVDTRPPDPVGDLAVASATDTSVTLTWTAPSDESEIADYDLRYRENYLYDSVWNTATQVENEILPHPAGQQEMMTVGIPFEGRYAFGLRVRDAAGNWSMTSNVVNGEVSTNYRWSNLELSTGCPLAVTAYPTGGFITVATAREILQLQTNDWVSIAPSPGSVKAMTYLDTAHGYDLITAGDFGVLRWNGSFWDSLGSTRLGPVEVVLVHDNQLYAGGSFQQQAGEEPARSVARWDGKQWHSLGSGTDGTVYALGIYKGVLIAAGSFSRAGGLSASCVAAWDGTAWHPVGSVLSRECRAVAVFDGELFVVREGSSFESEVARWDGSSWHAFGHTRESSNPGVRILAVYHGTLVAGGNFTEIGGLRALNLARWDRHHWLPFGTQLARYGQLVDVRTILVQDDHLIVGIGNPPGDSGYLLRWQEGGAMAVITVRVPQSRDEFPPER